MEGILVFKTLTRFRRTSRFGEVGLLSASAGFSEFFEFSELFMLTANSSKMVEEVQSEVCWRSDGVLGRSWEACGDCCCTMSVMCW